MLWRNEIRPWNFCASDLLFYHLYMICYKPPGFQRPNHGTCRTALAFAWFCIFPCFFFAIDRFLVLGRRTLRSGREFSAFDLAVGLPVQPPLFFSVADCLRERLEAQKITHIYDEPADISPPSLPDPSLAPHSLVPPSPPLDALPVPLGSRDVPADLDISTTTSTLDRKKLGSKRRKKEKRERERAESSDPALKTIHFERREAAKGNVLKVDVDAAKLPRTKKAWIGKKEAQDGSEAPEVGPQMASLPNGLGSHSYTQEDVDRLTGTTGFSYICWLGEYVFYLTKPYHSC